ncbi:toll/interleukin-1 receptor domain-containing protein [Desulfospira joergensenii]|uniref:toll/interleukin-1 receptor domain-containing protein n=1 Tax=Desulfospira joergensenii TaxID=53329 RepID=UPI0003B3CF81|nr:toll/interleukin-1 receptor domain-containing protein [Desulfospira joergensenii]
MAYVTGCDWDVFISYCQKNNIPPVNCKSGWVDNFQKQFSTALEQQRSILSPSIFIDYKGLLPGDDLSHALKNAIDKTAVFLVILSHKYLESGWCSQERDEFFLKENEFSKRIIASAQSELAKAYSPKRIFVVEYEEVPRESWPKEFKSVLVTSMWQQDNQGRPFTLGWPEPSGSQKEYYTNIRDLSEGVAKQLRKLKQMSELEGWTPGDSETDAIKKKISQDMGDEDMDIEDCISLIIDSKGKEPELEDLIEETALENGVGYIPLADDHKTARNNRMDFMNKIRVCGGFMIIHEDDNKNRITAKMMAYKKAIASRSGKNRLCTKGRAFIRTRDPNNPEAFRPTPSLSFPHVKYIKHENMETTKAKLNEFFQEYKEEIKNHE